MAVAVTELLDSSTCSDSGAGVDVSRGFMVSGLEGMKAARVVDAVKHPDIPRLGAPHPSEGFLYATSRDAQMVDAKTAKVTVKYAIPSFEKGDRGPGTDGGVTAPPAPPPADLGTISVGATAAGTQTNIDNSGVFMTVSHPVDVEKRVEEFRLGEAVTVKVTVKEPDVQVRTTEFLQPQTVLTISRMEEGSPDLKARDFVGTVNSKALGVSKSRRGKDGPRTWLCTRISGTSNDGGETYQVSYEFQYNPNEWRFLAQYIDKKTGLPPSTDLSGEEQKFYNIYDETDFNELGIRFEGDTSKGILI